MHACEPVWAAVSVCALRTFQALARVHRARAVIVPVQDHRRRFLLSGPSVPAHQHCAANPPPSGCSAAPTDSRRWWAARSSASPAGSRAIQSHTQAPRPRLAGAPVLLPRCCPRAPLPQRHRAHVRAHARLAPRPPSSPPSLRQPPALQTTSLAPLRSFEAACRRLQAPSLGLARPLALPVAPRCVASQWARDTQAHGLPVSPKIQTLLVNPNMACLPTAAHGPGALIWSRVGARRRTHSEGQGA